MIFEVEDYGRVDEKNAIFTHFLEKLVRVGEEGSDYTKLGDVPVGVSATAHFRNGIGRTVLNIRRIM